MEIRYWLAKKPTVHQLADLNSWKGKFLVLEMEWFIQSQNISLILKEVYSTFCMYGGSPDKTVKLASIELDAFVY